MFLVLFGFGALLHMYSLMHDNQVEKINHRAARHCLRFKILAFVSAFQWIHKALCLRGTDTLIQSFQFIKAAGVWMRSSGLSTGLERISDDKLMGGASAAVDTCRTGCIAARDSRPAQVQSTTPTAHVRRVSVHMHVQNDLEDAAWRP